MKCRVSTAVVLTLGAFIGSTAFAANGRLNVNSFPTGAEVYVDGAFTGDVTPTHVTVPEGAHEVMVQVPGDAWMADTRIVEVLPGQNDLSVSLAPNLSSLWTAIADLQTLVAAQQVAIDGLTTQNAAQQATIDTLQGDLSIADNRITSLESNLTLAQGDISMLQGDLVAAKNEIGTLQLGLSTAEGTISSLESDLATALEDLDSLATSPVFDLEPYLHVDYNTLENLVGPHVIFEGVNVHVRNGTGQTAGATGVGNLIVGYNEDAGFPRGGSHNIVAGYRNGYSSWGGLVAGSLNVVSAPWSSVTGGQWNTASGAHSSVSGGNDNTASAYCASVSR